MENVFVVDVGAHTIKYGTVRRARRGNTTTFSGAQQTPTLVENSCHGTVLEDASSGNADKTTDDAMFGDPFSLHAMSTFSQQLLRVLNDSPCNAGEYTLMLLVSPLTSLRFKELLVRAAFEDLAAKRVFIGYAPCMALFAVGTTTGLVVDIGFRGTTICPVSNATPMFPFVEFVPGQGMQAIDSALASACVQANSSFPSASEIMARYSSSFLHSVKAECCSLLPGLRVPPTGSALPTLLLPDGTSLRCPLSPEQYIACSQRLTTGTSLLFSVQQTVRNVLRTSPTWPTSWMLIGGGASLPGVENYMMEGLSTTPRNMFGVVRDFFHQPCRDSITAAWSGAAVAAQLSTFPGLCIDREVYEDSGPRESLRYNMCDTR